MSHLAINWILIPWRATNQDGELIAIMLHEEQLKAPESLNMEKGRGSCGGGGRLRVAFRYCKGFYGWKMEQE